jgi:dihydroorotase
LNALVLDCENKWVAPGLVDLRTFCGELGMQHREDFATLSEAALAGGYTDLVLGPWGVPCVDNPAVVTDLLARSARYPVRYHALGSLMTGLDGTEIAELGLMQRAGIIGVCDGNNPFVSTVVLRRALQYAERLGLPVFLTPSDPDLRAEGVMHEGDVSTRIGLAGIPVSSERLGASRIHALQVDTRAKCCALPIGDADSLSHLPDLRTATSARSLLLSDGSIEESLYNPSLYILPPLRNSPDKLVEALKDNRIEMIFADHTPLTRVEQDCEFALATPGAMGIETALSVAHTVLQDVPLLWEKMCFAPARFLGISKRLHVGSNADIVIFDPNMEWVPKAPFRSKGINEPLIGYPLKGCVCAVLVKEHVEVYHH